MLIITWNSYADKSRVCLCCKNQRTVNLPPKARGELKGRHLEGFCMVVVAGQSLWTHYSVAYIDLMCNNPVDETC